MAVGAPSSRMPRWVLVAPAVALGLAGATPAFAGPYPPPDQPTTSTSATEVQAGQPVDICAEHYAPDASVQLSDNDRHVATVDTGADGNGCVTVVWSSPQAKAHPTKSSALSGRSLPGRSAGASGVTLVALASPPGTVCHTMTNSGPDRSGQTATTSSQVCVEPGDSSGSSTSGGHVEGGGSDSASGSRASGNNASGLPFTGLELAGILAAAAALIGLGLGAMAAGRRRRVG